MATRAILNKIEPKMEVLADSVHCVDESLRGTNNRVDAISEVQETLQDRMDVTEEEVSDLKGQYVEVVNRLNAVIKELNNLKCYLKTMVNKNIDDAMGDLRSADDFYCHEEIADISDDEQ